MQEAKNRLPAEIPNMQVIAEYKEKDALYLQRAADLEKITPERNRIRDIYETARRRRIQECFSQVSPRLQINYWKCIKWIIGDPFSEGIAFSVRPPKKSWKNICNLSGGEKTLNSLALVFALHHYKPTPLYFMDEIDAALDFKNVSIVGNYIKRKDEKCAIYNYIFKIEYDRACRLSCGICKTYNCTKSVTVDSRKYYERNGITPATQIISKNLYSAQMQKFWTQSQHKERYTTPSTNNGEAAYKNQETNINTLK